MVIKCPFSELGQLEFSIDDPPFRRDELGLQLLRAGVSMVAVRHEEYAIAGRVKGNPTLRVVVMTAPADATDPAGVLTEERQRAGWAAFVAACEARQKEIEEAYGSSGRMPSILIPASELAPDAS